MQAIELHATVTPEHELRVRLAGDSATGPARVIVLFETGTPARSPGNLDAFLDALPINQTGGITYETACERIADERAAWGEA
jgi:hypothetical protein